MRLYQHWACDAAFILAAALFAWLAACGSVDMAACGAIMDSDLETYAQGMAGESQRNLFANDPVLARASAANSIPNLQRLLAACLAPEGEWASGLLRAGGVAIFLFYAGWYCLGRRLFGRPALAALLALCCGVTIWVGWGTFWGVLHSDPVPRVFFAALLPFLLWLFFSGLGRPSLRPLAMLATGLCIWVHGVSALNCGAMFFTAYMVLTPWRQKPVQGALNTGCALLAFLAPAVVFLWPSLIQSRPFSQEELAIFRELFNLRWQEDYAGFGGRLIRFFSPLSPAFPILLGGAIGWLILRRKGRTRYGALLDAYPCLLGGIAIVAMFCWLEGILAPGLGRLPMGHELVRGLRLLVPISWLMIVPAAGLMLGKWPIRALLCMVIAASVLISRDRQFIAAQYALDRLIGIHLPLARLGAMEAARAQGMRAVYTALKAAVPPGEDIFCPVDAMPARYIAMRPLSHSFKDGYAHFYNKDQAASARWLLLENTAREQGWQQAWLASESRWLLLPPGYALPDPELGSTRLTVNGWRLLEKNNSPDPAP